MSVVSISRYLLVFYYKLFYESTLNKEYIHTKPTNWRLQKPTSTEKQLGACERCPAYQFSSATEKQRRYSLFHRRQTGPLHHTKDFVCQYENYIQQFESVSTLNRHTKTATHTARVVRLLNGLPKKKKSEILTIERN